MANRQNVYVFSVNVILWLDVSVTSNAAIPSSEALLFHAIWSGYRLQQLHRTTERGYSLINNLTRLQSFALKRYT